MPHFTPRRDWAPLSDAEWSALTPHLRRWMAAAPGSARRRAGRPLGSEWRARLDAMLWIAVSGQPWHALPEQFGKPDTVSRHFRRLAHAGLWARLLAALALPTCPPALRAIEYWLCRAARRAMRLLGMAGLTLARRLGLFSALPMLPCYMPNRDLSEALHRFQARLLDRLFSDPPPPGTLTRLGRLLAYAGGRRVWSKKFAPP
ncbi:transposase [Siccirubricoccus sp. G192]|uniref:transposase n=1 Tax=Siccirubricoccus sp. G192 TaxID=2849651 RepID=UPI001C2BA2F2|nr:transposase [Siccirubricoccus sp. G192]MBV1798977.1 transposase [Siccirubricoccus sp. G192]